MVVLSLFDGMSTGQQALRNLGFRVSKYYASEIKKHAIELTKHHFPNTVHLGDVKNWRSWSIDWSKVDLVLSGSPCQDLSSIGKRKGLHAERSSLFFTFVDILTHIRKYNRSVLFLQENVASAKKEDIEIMTETLSTKPVLIDSKFFTAQRRRRLWWTNIKVKTDSIRDAGIMFKDIIGGGMVDKDKAMTLTASYAKSTAYRDKIKLHKYFVKKLNNSYGGAFNYVIDEDGLYRALTQTEMERLQGFEDGYTSILNRTHAGNLLGDAWTLLVIEYIFSFI
ncbi:MAG: DNA methyltransferase [Chitinophagales bacterium]|nr:MAG: DNA methyltransferase [Chitinophagales bacterium]